MALQILLCCLAAGGILGLLLELKTPGLLIPGVAGLLCLIAFFWLQAGGNTVVLAAGLFVLGVALVVLEVAFLPGHGVAAGFGFVLALVGFALAGAEAAPETADDWLAFGGRVIRYGLATAVACVAAAHAAQHLPAVPGANRLVLAPPEEPPEDAGPGLIGRVGTTTSDLRPGGKADFGGRPVDVFAEPAFIGAGERVQVVAVDGPRVVVRSIRTV
ncbi:MAG TPA: NfeD family protein [Gemmataceae bacterium]|nr:NfeD family protein [Gemmataceae bacterium]